MTLTMELLISVAVGFVSIMGFVIRLVWKAAAEARAIQERLAKLETKVEVFWKALETNLVNLLKLPTHLLMDELLDKLAANTLGRGERAQLSAILAERLQTEENTAMKVAISLVLARLKVKGIE